MFVTLRIFHRRGAKLFSVSPFRVDPRNRINPIIVTKTVDQCIALQWLAENRATPRNVKISRTQIASEAMKLLVLAHPLQDRIRHRSDLMMVEVFEIN